jgi:hypothetical protein
VRRWSKAFATNREILSLSLAAAYLGVSRAALRDWIKRGIGPPRLKSGRNYYFVRLVLNDWRDANPYRLRTAVALLEHECL